MPWFVSVALAAPVTELTLDEAFERLESDAPDLALARDRADAADGLARQVRAAWMPVLAATGSYTRNDHEVVLSFADLLAGLPVPGEAPPDATLQPLEAWTLAGTARIPLLAPAAWAEDAAAHRSAEAAAWSSEEVDRALQAELVAAAAGVEAAEGLLRASERALEVAREHQRAAEAARTAGTATAADALTAEATVARREGEVVGARRAVVGAQEALGALLGLDGPARVTWPDGEPPLDEPLPPPSLDAARASLDAARAEVRAAWLRSVPTVSATGTALASTEPFPTGASTAWRVGAEATFVLYDGGFRYGRLDQARAERAAATVELSRREREVARAIRETDAEVAAAREALALAEQQADLARRAADVARRGFETGTSSALVSRDADAEAFGADVEVVAARARLRTALAAARRARGLTGGW